MGEIQSERFRKKNETEQEKRGHKEKGKLNKELSLNKDTKGRSTSLSHFCLSLSTNPFFHSFLVVLVCLTISCPLTLSCFICVCVCMCVCQQVTWSVIRVSGTELSHIDRASPPLSVSLSNTDSES